MKRPWSSFTPKVSLTDRLDGNMATSIRRLWTFITYEGLKTQHDRTGKKGLHALFGSKKKWNQTKSSYSRIVLPSHVSSSDRSICAAVLFYKSGADTDLCEEPALIMHEPQLPGENTTRAGERGKEARQEAQKARFRLIPGLASFWRKELKGLQHLRQPDGNFSLQAGKEKRLCWSQTPYYDEIMSCGSDMSEGVCVLVGCDNFIIIWCLFHCLALSIYDFCVLI